MTNKPKYIETPEKMWEHFQAYVKYTKENPFLVRDWVGKDADQVERPKEKPLTFEGFETYCFREGIINDLGDYFKNKEGRYEAYASICRIIKAEIRRDQIEGGMAMLYNPSITQRLNGLVEKAQTDNTLTIKMDGGDSIST